MNRTGGWRATLFSVTAVLGAGLALGAVIAAPAQANDDLDKYAGDKKEVTVTPGRTYSQADDQTTFTFSLATKDNQAVSHVILLACKEIPIVSASGPDGPAASTEAKQDPAIKEPGHEGIKFDPGKAGTYTIVFAGDILGAEFVVKDGDGHKHFRYGSEGDLCKKVTQQTPSTPQDQSNPPGEEAPEPNIATDPAPPNNPPANNPPSTPASNQPGQPGSQVLGTTETNNPSAAALPETSVLGAQESQPEAPAATLPRTGSDVALLAPIGALLLAFGGVTRVAARRG